MRNTLMTAAIIGAFLFPAGLLATPEAWHKNLEDGRKGAGKSGKPILVITTWSDGV